jgi:hypothetical protein
MKDRLNVQNETLNEKYTGMPSDVGRSTWGAFKYLSDRVWKSVQGWLELLLLAGGKEIYYILKVNYGLTRKKKLL